MYSKMFVYIAGMFYDVFVEPIDEIIKIIDNEYPFMDYVIIDERGRKVYEHKA